MGRQVENLVQRHHGVSKELTLYNIWHVLHVIPLQYVQQNECLAWSRTIMYIGTTCSTQKQHHGRINVRVTK